MKEVNVLYVIVFKFKTIFKPVLCCGFFWVESLSTFPISTWLNCQNVKF